MELAIINDQLDIEQIKHRAHAIIDTAGSLDEYEAFDFLDTVVVSGRNAREVYSLYLSLGLYLMKQAWEEDRVPLTKAGEYEHDFHTYAFNRTGYKQSTIDNMVDLAGSWLKERPKWLPEEVEVYDAEGEPTGVQVQAEPWNTNMSKLLFAKAAAKDGRLEDDPVALGQLFNPEVPAHTLLDTINKVERKEPETNVAKTRLFLEGPYLLVKDGFSEAELVCEFNLDGGRAVKQVIKQIKENLNV